MRSLFLWGAIGALWTTGCVSRQPSGQVNQEIQTTIAPPTSKEVVTEAASTATQIETNRNSTSTIASVSRGEDPSDDTADDSLLSFSRALKSGDSVAAAKHLERYVHQHPDQVLFRLQLAELLIQLKKDARAKTQYEKFVASAQTGPEAVRKYLVHAHTRLMEIAQRSDDSFAEFFHRGVGLLALVQQEAEKPDRDDEFCEEMLCKSLRALNEARQLKPGDPRVNVYLAEVYERMGNRRASKNERSAARNRMVSDELTDAEQALIIITGL